MVKQSKNVTTKVNRSDQKKAVEGLRRHQRRLLDHPGVTSVGVGFRIRNGKQTDELCIQCTVDRKLAPEALLEEGRIALPESVETVDGTVIPIDVVQRNYRPSYQVEKVEDAALEKDYDQLRRSFRDPMVPGVSVSHINGSAGSIGAFVYDASTGEPLLLSNWHVLDGGGSIGDTILQPGPYDDPASQGNECGTLLRSHLGMAGDCAVAKISFRDFHPSILELNRVPRRIAEPDLGDDVVKSGRTTGVTHGIVSRIDVVLKINYGGTTGVREVGGFEIRPNPSKPPTRGEISMGGDSGSLWLVDVPLDHADADVAVGLHFAGETDPAPDAEHAIACKITSVVRKLNVTLEPAPEHITSEGELWREVFDRLLRLETQAFSGENKHSCACQGSDSILGSEPTALSPEAGIPVHGNWCGPGHGAGQPVDRLDMSCMHHDQCYDRKGYLDCGCDQALVSEIDRAIANGQLNGSTAAKALMVRSWFANSPCVRHVSIGKSKIPIPLPGRINRITSAGNSVGNAIRRLQKRLGF
jgi:hypothetical protein